MTMNLDVGTDLAIDVLSLLKYCLAADGIATQTSGVLVRL